MSRFPISFFPGQNKNYLTVFKPVTDLSFLRVNIKTLVLFCFPILLFQNKNRKTSRFCFRVFIPKRKTEKCSSSVFCVLFSHSKTEIGSMYMDRASLIIDLTTVVYISIFWGWE